MANCLYCSILINDQQKVVSCSSCNKVCHSSCAFLNVVQQKFLTANSIPWICQCCYFNKFTSLSSTVAALSQTVYEIKENFNQILENIKSMSSGISVIHQEFSQRIDSCEVKLKHTDHSVKHATQQGVPNNLLVSGVNSSQFKSNNDVRSYIESILEILNVTSSSPPEFDFKWSKSHLEVFFLNKMLVMEIKDRYDYYLLNHKEGLIISNGFTNLQRNKIIISFETVPSDDFIRRLDNNDIDRLSRDIILTGVQYLVTETSATLSNYVIDIAAAVDVVVAYSDFNVRRINKTSKCVVTFINPMLRDKVFYSFMSKMKIQRTGGILMSDLNNVPCVTNVNLNENLCYSSRIIFHFCCTLKYHYQKINSISTRRGRVAIKTKDGGNWMIVSSLNELFQKLYTQR